jgi:predicted PurR-regulated permease PerM
MPRSSKLLVTVLCLLLAAILLVWIKAGAVLVQLFIALALAYLLNPLVKNLEQRGLNRTVSVLLVFSLALIGISLVLVLLTLAIKSELSKVQLNIPAYATRLYELIPLKIKSYLQIDTPDRLAQQLSTLTLELKGSALAMVKPLLQWLQQAVSSTVGLILSLLGYLIIPIYLFYLLVDMPLLTAWLKELPPLRFREQLGLLIKEFDTVLSGFVRGQLLVCAILALLYSAGLWLIGIDLAVVIGTLSGAAFIIPYVGTVLGIILSMLMAALKFHDLLHPLLCLGWFALVQALEGTVITPKVVGDTVGLHPLIAIVALLIGGQLIGISGMLLAIPVAAILKVLAGHLLVYYRASAFYQGS